MFDELCALYAKGPIQILRLERGEGGGGGKRERNSRELRSCRTANEHILSKTKADITLTYDRERERENEKERERRGKEGENIIHNAMKLEQNYISLHESKSCLVNLIAALWSVILPSMASN